MVIGYDPPVSSVSNAPDQPDGGGHTGEPWITVWCFWSVIMISDECWTEVNWRVLCEWSAGGEAGDADGTDAGGGGVTSAGSGQRMKISSRKRHSLANKPQDFQVHRNVSLRCVVFSFTISVQGILCFIVTLRSVCGWSRAVSCLVITSDLWWRFTCVQKLTEHASRKEIIPTLMRYVKSLRICKLWSDSHMQVFLFLEILLNILR